MYCPNCGTRTLADQNFCRACGLGLEKIAQSLADQLPTELDNDLQARKNRFERLGKTTFSLSVLPVLILLLFGSVYLLTHGQILGGLAILGVIAVSGCGVLSIFLFEKAKEATTKRQIRQPKEIRQGGTTGTLLSEGDFAPMVSVTERTTELLFAEREAALKRVER